MSSVIWACGIYISTFPFSATSDAVCLFMAMLIVIV